jgi:hypothetical protein
MDRGTSGSDSPRTSRFYRSARPQSQRPIDHFLARILDRNRYHHYLVKAANIASISFLVLSLGILRGVFERAQYWSTFERSRCYTLHCMCIIVGVPPSHSDYALTGPCLACVRYQRRR